MPQSDFDLDELIEKFLFKQPEQFSDIKLMPITPAHIIKYLSFAKYDEKNIFKGTRLIDSHSSRILAMTMKGKFNE